MKIKLTMDTVDMAGDTVHTTFVSGQVASVNDVLPDLLDFLHEYDKNVSTQVTENTPTQVALPTVDLNKDIGRITDELDVNVNEDTTEDNGIVVNDTVLADNDESFDDSDIPNEEFDVDITP